MLTEATLEPVAERGVRVVFDCLFASTARDAGADRIVALERASGARAECSAIARDTQVPSRPSLYAHAPVEGGTR